MATRLSSDDLLPGEESVGDYTASYHAIAADWGLRAHGGGLFAGAFGIKGVEVVGGTLHLTTWRLIFAANAVNRLTGNFSLSLRDISRTEDISRGVKRAVVIGAGDQSWQFGMTGTGRFLEALEAQRAALNPSADDSADGALATPPPDTFRAR